MKILLTGATGFIGKALLQELFIDGHDLSVITRNKARAESELGIPITLHECDLLKTIPDQKIFDDVDAVIHLAGESLASKRWSEDQKKRIRESRILGTKNLVSALKNSSVKTFISTSAIGYYGSRGDETLNESSTKGEGFLADVCSEWENQVQGLQSSAIRTVILRVGVVLAQNGGALEQILQPFHTGIGAVVGNGKQWMSWIHRNDLIRILKYVLEKPSLSGPINAVSTQPQTNKEFTKTLSKIIKRPAPFHVPEFVLKTMLGEMATIALDSYNVVPQKLIDSGFHFEFQSLENALQNICGDFPNTYFEAVQFIPKPIHDVFSFFSTAKNLETITPPWLNFKILSQTDETIRAGTKIEYKISVHGIPMKWKTLILNYSPNKSFTDIQTQGPYSQWIHTHRFFEVPNGTLMTDHISYRIPLGGLGKLLSGNFVSGDIKKIFNFRKKTIASLFKN